MRKIKNFISILFFFLSLSSFASLGIDDLEPHHLLSIGGGISSPSVTSSLYENPAGLAYNYETRLLGSVGAGDSNFNPMNYAGTFYFGNGSVGGGLGAETIQGKDYYSGSSATLLNFGLGALVESLNLSVGVAGSYFAQRSGDVYLTTPMGSTTDQSFAANLGLIYNPKGDLRFGFTAFQLQSSFGSLGAGFAYNLNPWATFSFDGAMTKKGDFKTLKPSLGIHTQDFQLTLGYGIALDSYANPWLRKGTSVGIGYRMSAQLHLQAYYNQLAHYYLGLSAKF